MGVAFLNLTPTLPALQASYGVSSARMGLLITALVFTHSAVQVPAGLVVDRLGVRAGLLLALGLGFLGSFFSVFSLDYGFVLTLRLLTGLGTGLSFVAGIHYATYHAPDERKLPVQAVFGGLINVGSTVPFLVATFLPQIGQGLIHLYTAGFFLFPLLAVLVWGRDPVDTIHPSRPPLRKILHSGPAWTLGLSHAVFFGGMMTLGTWITSYLMRSAALTATLPWIGAIGGLVIALSAFGRFLGAWMPAGLNPRILILGALAVLTLSYGVVSVGGGLLPGVGFMGIAALMNSVTFASVFHLAYRIAPPQVAGTTFGLVNFIASVGAFLFPVVFGALLDLTGAFTVPFLFLACLAALAFWRCRALPAEARKTVGDG